jgi:hypothetical protein
LLPKVSQGIDNNSIKETYDFLGKKEVRLSNKLKYLKIILKLLF